MNENKPLITVAAPKFAEELEGLLRKANQPQLAESVDSLRIYEKCGCGEKSCASFYTAPQPVNGFGINHENLLLDAKIGLLILDVVDGEIKFIEVLDRPEYKEAIDQI